MLGVYLCEVKGLQPFIFESGKLKEIVGASELLAALTDAGDGAPALLDEVLRIVGSRALQFMRRAGGAVYTASADLAALARFRQLWALALRVNLPGVEIVQGYGEDEDFSQAMNLARQQLQTSRAQPVRGRSDARQTCGRDPRV